ncbi:hypothetical protein X781_9560 [Mannheimia sp. USDA-ARS-USMARC-1261]|nr:hypothetical protein X781_9560 [Mannheimia sp. USDA-ARS-USMARC-1261]AHG79431.1 hypothetical protein X875_8130 [Mannheimia varigena USDA-ARS-USMARC-1388]
MCYLHRFGFGIVRAVAAVSAVHKQVHQGAEHQQGEGQKCGLGKGDDGEGGSRQYQQGFFVFCQFA